MGISDSARLGDQDCIVPGHLQRNEGMISSSRLSFFQMVPNGSKHLTMLCGSGAGDTGNMNAGESTEFAAATTVSWHCFAAAPSRDQGSDINALPQSRGCNLNSLSNCASVRILWFLKFWTTPGNRRSDEVAEWLKYNEPSKVMSSLSKICDKSTIGW